MGAALGGEGGGIAVGAQSAKSSRLLLAGQRQASLACSRLQWAGGGQAGSRLGQFELVSFTPRPLPHPQSVDYVAQRQQIEQLLFCLGEQEHGMVVSFVTAAIKKQGLDG